MIAPICLGKQPYNNGIKAAMPIKSSLLRLVAQAVLIDRGFEVSVKPGQGYLPGSRLVAKKNGKRTIVAVKASKERALSFTRQPDGKWRTLHAVGLVLAVVPAEDNEEEVEVLAFERDALVAAFDRAWKALQKEERPLSFNIPVFVPLDEVGRKNVGHDVGNLKKLSIWPVRLTAEQARAKSVVRTDESYIDSFIRRYAKENGVAEQRVFIGIGGRGK
jgi:hypothetical protein